MPSRVANTAQPTLAGMSLTGEFFAATSNDNISHAHLEAAYLLLRAAENDLKICLGTPRKQ